MKQRQEWVKELSLSKFSPYSMVMFLADLMDVC